MSGVINFSHLKYLTKEYSMPKSKDIPNLDNNVEDIGNVDNNELQELSFLEVIKEEYAELFISKKSSDKDLDKDLDKEYALCEASNLKEFFLKLHESGKSPMALCLSGGGIRSATFALGVLQGLAEKGTLNKFHYLSTVSGGGYIGSWLNAWIHRSTLGKDAVIAELKNQKGTVLKEEEDKNPIDHLRVFSNYLSPQVGLSSADTWTLIAIYLRNLFLNWLVIIPFMLAVLMLPRIYVSSITALKNSTDSASYATYSLILGFIFAAFSMVYISVTLPENIRDPLKKLQSEKWFLIFCLAPFFISSILVSIWMAIDCNSSLSWKTFPIFAIAINFIGFFCYGLKHKFEKNFRHMAKSLNIALVVLIISFLSGILAWIIATKDFLNFSNNSLIYSCVAIPLIFVLFSVAGNFYIGFTSNSSDGDQDREWWARCGAWVLIVVVGWLAINGLVIYGPLILLEKKTIYPALVGLSGTISGLISVLGGFSGKTSAKKDQEAQSFNIQLVLKLAAFLFLVAIVISLSLLTTQIILSVSYELPTSNTFRWLEVCKKSVEGAMLENHKEVIGMADIRLVLMIFAGLLLIGTTMGFAINPNKFSLNGAYRNRLIRAYLGASRIGANRKPNAFTGFDPDDNIEMHKIGEKLKGLDNSQKLLHVVNITLNLINGDNLAWQERKAESFTVSPFHCGNFMRSYRRAKAYGDAITLGTALSISGAAASPNMGYNSSAIVTMLMTFFNVRMGWWLGNPSYDGQTLYKTLSKRQTWQRSGPVFSLGPLVREALGKTNDKDPYVYLSDGGHFENLGLYEMVLRRCKKIVVVDGSCDPKFQFEDLANAIRKIRVDLGIKIEFKDWSSFLDKDTKTPSRFYALATIKYSEVDGNSPNNLIDGELIYIKPSLLGSEPVDVSNYKKINRDFPHETTADQFFSESQFESYRALGYHAIKKTIEETESQSTFTW
jgi:hypothetical protein